MSGSSDREILNIEEAAALLGVSIKTFNKVLHTEEMPARKIGREWKFSRRALINWVGNGNSREFYRDSEASRGDAARGTDSSGNARRTQGWHIETD
jgi:excisionase family DNA binding protein